MNKANKTLSAAASEALRQPDGGTASFGSEMMTPELKAAVEKVNAWHWGQEQERLQQNRSQLG